MKTEFLPKYIIAEVFIAMMLSFLLTACKTANTTPLLGETTPDSEPQVFSSASYITATSIPELTNKSTIVIIGKAVSKDDVINMARDVEDISKPDPDLFGIGQVYEFEVASTLKGEQEISGAKRIYVVQSEGMIILSSQNPPTEEDIEKAREKEKYISISVGNDYVLFLEPLVGFPDLKLHYTGVAQPWRFNISDTTGVVPESPWEGASRFFPPQPLETFIQQIEHPELLSSPYPPPNTPYP